MYDTDTYDLKFNNISKQLIIVKAGHSRSLDKYEIIYDEARDIAIQEKCKEPVPPFATLWQGV